MKKSARRFTPTVENYLKYRPGYPQALLDVLIRDCQLTEHSIIGDIGSGTGFLSKLFLDFGNIVYGVEPNDAMREAATIYLNNNPRFHQLNGTAEATLLPDQSIDIITAGTAFHWFDAQKSKIEFQRILKPTGWVLLIWNVRDLEQSSLMQDYEQLILTYGTDYVTSQARQFDKTVVADFFLPDDMKTCWFKNSQVLDWEGLKGRLLSTSYSLRPQDAKYHEMLDALKSIFEQYQQNGMVEFLYKTKLYYGQLNLSAGR